MKGLPQQLTYGLLIGVFFTGRALKPENFAYESSNFGLVQGKRQPIKDAISVSKGPARRATLTSLPKTFGGRKAWENKGGGKVVVMSKDPGGDDFGCSESQGGAGVCQLRCSGAMCTNAKELCAAKPQCVAVGLNADFSWGTLKKQSTRKPVDVNAYIRNKEECELGDFAPGTFESGRFQQERQESLPYCGMRADELRGYWSRDSAKPPQYSVEACRVHRFTAKEARTCLRDQHIAFAGDSTTRYQYLSMVYFLVRVEPPSRLQFAR
jgi:hypothetical protein